MTKCMCIYIYLYIIGYSPNNVIVKPLHHVTFNNRTVATKTTLDEPRSVDFRSCFGFNIMSGNGAAMQAKVWSSA